MNAHPTREKQSEGSVVPARVGRRPGWSPEGEGSRLVRRAAHDPALGEVPGGVVGAKELG